MEKVFSVLGWIMAGGGIGGGVVVFVILNRMEFLTALLARVVEDPFAYQSMAALIAAMVIALLGCLFAAGYLGLAELLRRNSSSVVDPG